LPFNWTLGRAAELRISVEQALMREVPGLRASIQLLPSDMESHYEGGESGQDGRDLLPTQSFEGPH
jgi:hypothetical protein